MDKKQPQPIPQPQPTPFEPSWVSFDSSCLDAREQYYAHRAWERALVEDKAYPFNN